MLTVFLNGRAVGSATFDGTFKAVDGEAIGLGDSAGAPSPGARFRGYVDELAVWHRPLEPTEIAAHFQRRELERGRRPAELERLAAVAARLQRFGCEEIVFCSSRAKRYIGCWLAQAATLHRCDPAGSNSGASGVVT